MKILALGAHPDDIEIFMYGLISIYKKEGNQVFTMIATDGSKGGSSKDNLLPKKRELPSSPVLMSPMPGLLVDLDVGVGDEVHLGQRLCTLEAMKMENVSIQKM